MGPIFDELGLEQGGINSSDFYKIFGKEQLHLAQKSNLGIKIEKITIATFSQHFQIILKIIYRNCNFNK